MALPLVFAIGLLAGAPAEAGVADVWVVEGRVSDNPHAHPVQPEKGQRTVYLDSVAEGQIVAYLKSEPPPMGAWVRLSGTALRFETTSPRPGSTKRFPVKQLTVEKVERLTGCDAVQALLTKERRSAELHAAIDEAGKDAFPVLIANLDGAPGKEWQAWWLKHREKPLKTMRAERKRLIDDYFKSAGDPQSAP